MIKFMLCALCAFASTAQAEVELVVPTVSHHFSSQRTYNEVHPGIGLKYNLNKDSAVVLVYTQKNSIGRPSTYLMFDYAPLQLGPLALGGFVGGATGYIQSPRVIAGLLLRFTHERVTFDVRYGPKAPTDLHGAAVVTFSVGIPLRSLI